MEDKELESKKYIVIMFEVHGFIGDGQNAFFIDGKVLMSEKDGVLCIVLNKPIENFSEKDVLSLVIRK